MGVVSATKSEQDESATAVAEPGELVAVAVLEARGVVSYLIPVFTIR